MSFPTSGRVYVWRTSKEAGNPEGLVPTVKYGGGSVMILTAISWYSACPTITHNGPINAIDNVGILGNRNHPVVQMLFHNNDADFEDDRAPINQPEVFSLGFRSMKMHFNIFLYYYKYYAAVYV